MKLHASVAGETCVVGLLTQRLGFSFRNALPLILAPIIPLGYLAFCALLLAGFGVLYRLPWIGSVLAGILLIIPLSLAMTMTLMAAALAATPQSGQSSTPIESHRAFRRVPNQPPPKGFMVAMACCLHCYDDLHGSTVTIFIG